MKELKIFSFVILCNIIALISFSCQDEESLSCESALIEHYNMVAYSGEDLGCRNHINYYKNNNEYFSVLNNHCADLAMLELIGCDGNTICTSREQGCTDRITDAISLGTIGIAPE